jgi:hypothetical protein
VTAAYGQSVGGPLALPDPGKTRTVAKLTVPRGSYVISGKAVGGLTVPGFSCPQGTLLTDCVMLHNERRLASTIFGCAVQAGTSSDLGRANLIAGANQQSAFQTVSAGVLHTFSAPFNKVALTCVQYSGGKWPVSISNARLIATRVNQVNPVNAFNAVRMKIVKAKKKPKLRIRSHR